MKAENSTRIQFDSLSSNEAYARGVTAAFLARIWLTMLATSLS